MMGSGAFAGVVEAVLILAFIIGCVLGFLLFGLPGYFIGKHYGKQEIYAEAQTHKALEIKYDEKTGEKVYIWIKPTNAKTDPKTISQK
jgi:hypothetical protein